MSEEQRIPQVTFITLEEFKKVSDEANGGGQEETPFRLEDYVNMVLYQLAEEGCEDIEISEFYKALGTAYLKSENLPPMAVTPYKTETYLFMVKFKSKIDMPTKSR
jgi:hypothetical protein